ncbi:MAG: peptidoglycan editing factor PgeF [Candidatus Gastranaerophilales bacterium]|nr:peptidoglycan editing factor PgeF [Candidatus Gastranaerophilales bacterium]
MFYFDDFYGRKILKSDLLPEADCFFTTRDFVLTCADKKDLEEEALKNREFLKNKLSCSEITTAKQTHSSNIEVVTKNKHFYDNTDALISNVKNSLLLMNFADCVPIILYSPKYNTGAVIHAGWRGTALEIAKKTIEKIKNELNIPPVEIIALIGPAIGKCCFETDEDVFNKLVFDKNNLEIYEKKNNKYLIDLKLLNKNQLINAGVENIDTCSYCTCCMSDIFFSYRNENGKTARHSAIIKIKGD